MAYSLKYSYISSSKSYSVTDYSNITTSDKVVIPSTYDDGTNGEHPVTSIGDNAFTSCGSLTSVTIPDSVTSIGYAAFADCRSLPSVTIPDSVTSISSHAFDGCIKLTSVTIPDSVTSIGEMAFYSCSNLTSVTIGNSVTSISGGAFSGCSSLTSVTIPDGVTSISGGAFQGCSSLTSITIPNNVTSIEVEAFDGCDSLKQLILFPLTPPTLGSNAIPSTISKIYVQQPSKAAYQAAANWATFASKIISDDIYLSFVRFNQKNKEYISEKVNGLSTEVAPILSDYVDDTLLGG